jgi:hypothetical protein
MEVRRRAGHHVLVKEKEIRTFTSNTAHSAPAESCGIADNLFFE